MRKIMFILLTTVLSIYHTVDAQKAYVSLKECNNDTIKYIETNFRDNKERYINQSFSKFTKEFEPDLYKTRSFYGREPNKHLVWGCAFLYINPGYDYFYLRDKKPYYCIFIEFERPYLKTDLECTIQHNNNPYKNAFRTFLNEYVVKDIEIRVGEIIADRTWKEAKW